MLVKLFRMEKYFVHTEIKKERVIEGRGSWKCIQLAASQESHFFVESLNIDVWVLSGENITQRHVFERRFQWIFLEPWGSASVELSKEIVYPSIRQCDGTSTAISRPPLQVATRDEYSRLIMWRLHLASWSKRPGLVRGKGVVTTEKFAFETATDENFNI